MLEAGHLPLLRKIHSCVDLHNGVDRARAHVVPNSAKFRTTYYNLHK
jgi:hypothetical protein